MENLWVVVPTYNEEESIVPVIEEWLPVLRKNVPSFVLCFLDDGSKDRSSAILDGLKAKIPELQVVHKKNSGHGQTCIEGFRLACRSGADWVLQIDSDGQSNAEHFADFWNARITSPIWLGQRFGRKDGLFRIVVSKSASVTIWLASGVWVRDANVPFRLIRCDLLSEILPDVPGTFYLANILLSVLLEERFGISWIPISFPQRLGGTPSTKASSFIKRGWELYWELRRFKATTLVAAPRRIAS